MPALGWANTAETSLLFEFIDLLEYSPLGNSQFGTQTLRRHAAVMSNQLQYLVFCLQ